LAGTNIYHLWMGITSIFQNSIFDLLQLFFPLSRAEHRRIGRKKARGLFERSEFPRAPVASTGR